MKKVKSLSLAILVLVLFCQTGVQANLGQFSLGIDKYNDLYMVDSATGIVHHFDSQTGIYLGKFIDATEIGAKSLTDISVCACGGAIALLDPLGNTVHVVDFEGTFLWKKDNTEPGLDFKDATAIGICQDSNYEHVILTTKSGKVYHVSPPNEPNKTFPDTYSTPGGAYMDYNKQVFIAETGSKKAIKTDQWGNKLGEFGIGKLSKPVDIATSEDSDRKIWVCDQENAKLHVFSKDLKHLFDCGEGYLTNPVSVITDYIDSGAYVVEVVDGKPKIHKFDSNGGYLFTILQANNLPVQTLLSAKTDSYVLQNRNNRALNRRLVNQPKLVDGKMFVEAKPVLESLGYTVIWDNKSKMTTFKIKNFTAKIPLSGKPIINGKAVNVSKPVIVSKSKMLISTDFLNQYFDITVNVSGQTIFLVSPKLQSWQSIPQPDLGKNLFETKCSKCHQTPVPDVRYRSEWSPIVQRMMAKNPGWISQKEGDLISRYLWGQAKPDKP
jgi:hypothetical protein